MWSTAFQTKQNVEKKKKKLSQFQRRIFYETMVSKGIENYCKVMMRLSELLASKNLMKAEKTEEALTARYAQRYKSLENVAIMKRIEFHSYSEARDNVAKMDVIYSQHNPSLTLI